MQNPLILFLKKRKYEILLVALIAHLYIGIFLTDLDFYARIVWPINMAVLGITSASVFMETGKVKTIIQNILWIIAFLLPVSISFLGQIPNFMTLLSIFYCVFFGFIFIEIVRFLIKPSYINVDIISASACGYFLLIEISVFLLQAFYYNDQSVLSNVNNTTLAETYMDLVYFSSISITSIGYGDITPTSYVTRLIISFFGVVSQFYAVVLVGILISKFVSAQDKKSI